MFTAAVVLTSYVTADDGGLTVLGIHLGNYSGEALAALFVVLIFLGVWRPRSEVRMWQKAAERSADQVDRLTDAIEPMVKTITELREIARAQEQARVGKESDKP